jgi:ATP-dependent DNA helicase RecG
MNIQDLQKNIVLGENEQVEFKTSFTKEVIESLVAFSNTKGGAVYIGVNDNKKIVGVTISDESIPNWINEIKQNTIPQIIPDVTFFELENKTIVVFSIDEYPIKPISYKNKYFKRNANSNHLLTLDEISNEHLKTINSSWDYYPDPTHTIQNISIDKVKKFINLIEQRTQSKIELQPLDFLAKLEMIRNNQPTFGAFLLFANDYCSISDVQIGRFKSDITIIDNVSLSTDLFTETDQILAFIKKHLMVEYIITGNPQNTERFDYPIDAIREIVINMIVHRDYRDSSASVIKIFDDRIEFYNPGKLIGNLTVQNLLTNNYTSQSRNKLVAKAFKEVGMIERYGSGISRIFSICKQFGIIEPVFEEVFNGIRIVIFKEKSDDTDDTDNDTDSDADNDTDDTDNDADNDTDDTDNDTDDTDNDADNDTDDTDSDTDNDTDDADNDTDDTDNDTDNDTDDTDENIDDRLETILKWIIHDNKITANQIANNLKISKITVKRDLEKLKQQNKIQRIGTEKTGSYILIKKSSVKTDDALNDTDDIVDNRLETILKWIVQDNKITANQIAKNLNISKITIKRDLEKLKEQNKIMRVGAEKTGHWQIL